MSRVLSKTPGAHKDAVWTVSFAGAGPGAGSEGGEAGMVVSGSVDGTLKSWAVDAAGGNAALKAVATVDAFPLGVVSLVPVGHGAAAASSMDGTIRIVNVLKGGAPLKVLRVGPVDCWKLAAGEGEIVSGTHTGAINVWNAESGALVRTIETGGTFALSVARFKNLVAVGHKDGAVRLYNLGSAGAAAGAAAATPAPPLALNGHAMPVRGVAFSPDGSILYTACDDRTSLCFSTEGGEQIGALRGHLSWVMDVAASRRHVATASADRTVKLWDAETRECLFTFDAHASQVFCVAFNAAGTLLASGAGAGDLALYSIVAPQR